MKLETKRLFLREMTPEDYDALYAVLADSDIMRHYPYTFDEARVKNWINKNTERYRVFGFGLWAVCLRSTAEMIGDCGLTMQNINGTILPEIGYHIAKAHQRQGYASEAAQAVRDWTFSHTPFGMAYSYMKKENIPSAAVAVANEMRLLDVFTDSEGEQTAVYGISRAEWTARGVEDGCLTAFPAKHKKKLAALWYLAGKLEADRQYTEQEINDLLDEWTLFHDPATLRRELYNKQLLDRTAETLPPLDAFIESRI